MNLDYRNDRNAFGQRDVGSSEESSRMNPNPDRQRNYGRDNASMRGNDFYGTQSYNSDYSRGNYSASTYNSGRKRQGGYATTHPEGREKQYVEFPDYSNRPTYGSYAGSRLYTDFIDHNYGYPVTEPSSTRYSTLEEHKPASRSKSHKTGTRTPFRSADQSRYSENDGRRR
ncbi:hypothetical protein [Pontibacter chinhatensis]|uniref:Uncharacterized protein n=1 Tax=Pontibacter chinhatensis TaxID=1436961 RepID=A0A1I2NPT9_9BACT|nr:hypothetical protein [Pontibacter chinhatensis]SFG05688.1 hypothetical protein SAMN05421739_101807 [Pontibacter chinhatensis]